MIVHTKNTEAELANKPDSFELWLSGRHKWLQTAAQRLIESKAPPTEQELDALTTLCLGEATGEKSLSFSAVVPGSLSQAAMRPELRIRDLSEVRGVNRIKDRAALSFGSGNLTLVYGTNGSGKTGFSRLLKQICGSRARENIHPNVFDKATQACEAKISIAVDGALHEIEWKLNGGPLPPLRDVHVFDSKTASNYVVGQNEARYEPSRMRFITALIRTCDSVSERLTKQRNALVKKMPQFPPEFSQTHVAKWLASLRSGTTKVAIEGACNYPNELDQERIAAEGALAQQDIAGRLLVITREQASLTQIRATLSSLRSEFSDKSMSTLLAAHNQALSKRKAATEAAESVFANAPLAGVGQSTWMSLWELARTFSNLHAYPNDSYPKVDSEARCVLCQQQLDGDAIDRMSHFEVFMKGGLESAATGAENAYKELIRKMPSLPQSKDWALQAAVLKLAEDQADTFLTSLKNRHAATASATALADLPTVDWSAIDNVHLQVTDSLNAEAKALKELQGDGKRQQLETRVKEIHATQWLSQNNVAINEELDRLNAEAAIGKAIDLTKTVALTRKHTDLAKDDLYKGYQDRFATELKALGGARLPVRPESKQAGKGKVTFGLQLQGIERVLAAELVLSEGETRIVALAAFLADITGSVHRSPFIFDDPISSLDQDFEEKVVRRLVALSRTRQVIVFTHRLSLVALIESEVKKLKDDAEIAKTPPPVELHIQSVCSFGNSAGIVQDIGIRNLKPPQAINRMRKERVPQLRKVFDAGDVAAYDERATSLCSDLRILVERSVESVLLNDVLNRFRRSLQTQGRIGALAKISPEDCALIDDLMTRYSAFEHSQSDELPAERPDISDIEADVAKLGDWFAEFSERSTT